MVTLSIGTIIFVGFLGLAPAVFWFWFWLEQKGRRTQGQEVDSKLLVLLFFAAMATTLVPYILQRAVTGVMPVQLLSCLSGQCNLNDPLTFLFLFLFMVLVVAPTEEITKYFTAKWIAFDARNFGSVADGIRYNIAVALGFATIENAIYFFASLSSGDPARLIFTFVARFFISTLAHTLYAGVVGYYMGQAKFNRTERTDLLRTGLMYGILIHGMFNFLLYSQVGFYAIFLLGAVFVALYFRFRDRISNAYRYNSIDPTAPITAHKPQEMDKVKVAKLKRKGIALPENEIKDVEEILAKYEKSATIEPT